jgi:trehalose 6-phosphate synthase
MSYEERSRRHEGLISIVTARNPGDWVDEQLADIQAKEGALAGTTAAAAAAAENGATDG